MHHGLIAELHRTLGASSVSTDNEQLDSFGGDALGVFRAFRAAPRLSALPGAVVSPTSTRDVSRLLRFAHRHQVPVVPYGGGTGVMGAASPVEDCIILNLRRMNAVLGISKEDMSACMQPGVILEDAARQLERSGLVFGHDPWSQPIATVGGAISTDGVGYTAAKYGSIGEQVMGLEVVLADGEVIRTKAVPKPSPGPALNHLFIGSEGTLGVITEATLRAFPQPEKRLLRAIEFPDFESGFRAVAAFYAEGVRPTMVDYGEEPWPGGKERNPGATLYLGFDGFDDDVNVQDFKAQAICQQLGGASGNPEEVQRFWETRHALGEQYRREVLQAPHPGKSRRRRTAYRMDYLHVALPVSQVLEYRRRCQELLSSNRILVREWSLWARPEFFSFIIVEEDDQGQATSPSLGEAVDKVLALAQELGGTMEYCHGAGVKLAHLMDRELGSGMAVVKKLKKALDPRGILNPGKLVSCV